MVNRDGNGAKGICKVPVLIEHIYCGEMANIYNNYHGGVFLQFVFKSNVLIESVWNVIRPVNLLQSETI